MITERWHGLVAVLHPERDGLALKTDSLRTAGPATVEVVSSFEAASVGRQSWDELVDRCDADLYASFDWCREWWLRYGRGRELRVILARAGDGPIVGILPMFVELVGTLGTRLRIARLVGADSTIAVIRPAVLPGWRQQVVAATLSHMIRTERCDAVLFGPLTGEEEYAAEFRAACAAHSDVHLLRDSSPGVHSVFELPERSESYVASLEKRVRDNFKRTSKHLARERAVRHEVVDNPEQLDRSFDEFAAMHARQWNAVGCLGHFGDWPGSESFTRAVIQAGAGQGRSLFMNLVAEGQTINRMHSLRMGRHLHWRLPARALGEEWDKLSIGSMALVKSIEAAIELGVTRLEAGPGHYDQKLRHGAKEYPLTSLLVVRRDRWARIRARLFLAAADLLHLCYYRAWRLKVAPRLPWRPGPLWTCWIRSRV